MFFSNIAGSFQSVPDGRNYRTQRMEFRLMYGLKAHLVECIEYLLYAGQSLLPSERDSKIQDTVSSSKETVFS